MHSVGVNTAEMRTIKRVLSAILHMGNVSFKDNGEGHLTTVDGDRSRQHMNWACELLGVDNVRYCLGLRNHVFSLEIESFL
jgi:myosin heavy subunit